MNGATGAPAEPLQGAAPDGEKPIDGFYKLVLPANGKRGLMQESRKDTVKVYSVCTEIESFNKRFFSPAEYEAALHTRNGELGALFLASPNPNNLHFVPLLKRMVPLVIMHSDPVTQWHAKYFDRLLVLQKNASDTYCKWFGSMLLLFCVVLSANQVTD
jgi:hypothetical protein